MPKAFLFLAAALIGFFVTVETPVGPEADTSTDFEPTTQVA